MEDKKRLEDDIEDLSILIDDVNEMTENLDDTVDKIEEKINQGISINKEERHSSDYDDDFINIVKKRDYKGKIEKNDPVFSRSNKKRKLKKWVYLLIIIVILAIGGGIGTYLYIDKKNTEKRLAEEKAIMDNIKAHYHEYAKVSKDTKLYEKKDNEYNEIGTIYKDANIELIEEEVKLDTKYFHIKDLDYYISFEDIEEGSKQEIDDRYKNYVPFNSNIITKDNFTMYINNEKFMTLNKEMEFPIIINNFEDKYYVEYNNMLVNISKDDVSKTKESKNTDKKNQSKITTLAYHRIYDSGESCTDVYVCMKKANFDKEMKYLADNNYFTLTMDEMYMYLKGNLQVSKGIVITLDDGYKFKAADEVLDKYKLNATMFVTSGVFKNFEQFKGLKAIDVQSHTHNMHRNYVCPVTSSLSQGGAILCTSKAKIVEDLKKSLELLEIEPIAMAFPFYDFNDNAIAAVKEAGFKMAFVGRAGVLGKATPKSTNLYKIPRMTVWELSIMSFNEWKSYL